MERRTLARLFKRYKLYTWTTKQITQWYSLAQNPQYFYNNNGDLTRLNILRPLYNIVAYRKGGKTTRENILQLIKQHKDNKYIHTRGVKTILDMCKLTPTIKTRIKGESNEYNTYTCPLCNLQFNTRPRLAGHFRDNAEFDMQNNQDKIPS